VSCLKAEMSLIYQRWTGKDFQVSSLASTYTEVRVRTGGSCRQVLCQSLWWLQL